MTKSAICQHLTTYLDVDEYVCRNCSRSLTFPARSPEEHAAEEKAKDERQTGQALDCGCCGRTLPVESFYRHPGYVSRGGFAKTCKPCTAYRKRLLQIANPAPNRKRTREHARKVRASIKAGDRPGLQPEQMEMANAANRRYRGRLKGEPIPFKERKRSIYLKPACAIACPLERHCTREGKAHE